MKFEFYKKGQGYYTRLCTGLGIGFLLMLGCFALYNALGVLNKEGSSAGQWIQMGIPFVIFVVGGWGVFKLVNWPQFADFMISTEGEMKKVSWSTRKEVIGATRIVIFSMFLMSIMLAATDFIFNWVFTSIGVILDVTKG